MIGTITYRISTYQRKEKTTENNTAKKYIADFGSFGPPFLASLI